MGEPSKVKHCASVLEAISKLESHLKTSPRLVASLDDLRGKRFICHCSRNPSCHADVLISAVAERSEPTDGAEATIHVGLPHGEVDFALKALELAHPFEQHSVPDAIVQGLKFRMSRSTAEVASLRRSVVEH